MPSADLSISEAALEMGLDSTVLLARWNQSHPSALAGYWISSVVLVGLFLIFRRLLFPIDQLLFRLCNSSLIWVPFRAYRYLWATLNTHRLGDMLANAFMIGYAAYVIIFRETRLMMDEHVARLSKAHHDAVSDTASIHLSQQYPQMLHTIYLYNIARLGSMMGIAMILHRLLSLIHRKLVLPYRVCPSKATFPKAVSISALLLNEVLHVSSAHGSSVASDTMNDDRRAVDYSPAVYDREPSAGDDAQVDGADLSSPSSEWELADDGVRGE